MVHLLARFCCYKLLFLGGADVFVGVVVVVVVGGGGHTMIKFCVCVNLLRGRGWGGFTSHRNPIWHAFQQPWLL